MTVDEEWLLLGKALEKIALLYGKYQVVLKAQRRAVVENKALDLLPLLAPCAPRIMAPISHGVCWLFFVIRREMWRWVT